MAARPLSPVFAPRRRRPRSGRSKCSYEDDFSDGASDWCANNEIHEADVHAGCAEDIRSYEQGSPGPRYVSLQLPSGAAALDVTAAGVATQGASWVWGVACISGGASGHHDIVAFTVNSDGGYRIAVAHPERDPTVIVDTKPSDAIETGAGATNRLEGECPGLGRPE